MKKIHTPKDILEEKIRETRKFISILEGEIPYMTDEKLKQKKQIYLYELEEELKHLIGKSDVTNNSKEKNSRRLRTMPKKGKKNKKKEKEKEEEKK